VTSAGTFTLYWKPPDSWRVDITLPEGNSIIISTGGVSYVCSEAEGSGQCFQSPVAAPVPFLTAFTDPGGIGSLADATFSGVDVDRFDETIAGQDGRCFRASGTVEGETGSGEYCFTDDGLLLRIRGSAQGSTFSLEATDVGGSVADTDLQPPYEIIEIPGQ
jgi:hypothetical protein